MSAPSEYLLSVEALAAEAEGEELAGLMEIIEMEDFVLPVAVGAAEAVGASVVAAGVAAVALPVVAVAGLAVASNYGRRRIFAPPAGEPQPKRRRRIRPTVDNPHGFVGDDGLDALLDEDDVMELDPPNPSDPPKPARAVPNIEDISRSLPQSNISRVDQMKPPPGYTVTSLNHLEYGSGVTDDNQVYVGVGPVTTSLINSISDAIVGALFCEAGISSDAVSVVGGTFRIVGFVYLDSQTSVATQLTTATFINQSRDTISGGLATTINAAITSNKAVQFIDFTFYQDTTNILSRIVASALSISITQQATMILQNQTTSNTAAAPDANPNSVTVNPLYGTTFECKGNQWRVIPARRVGSFDQMITSDRPYLNIAASDQYSANLSPNGLFENGKRIGSSFTLVPGKLVSLKSGFTETHFLNTWAAMIPTQLDLLSPLNPVGFGHSKMIIFERSVHYIGTEPKIMVGFEVDYKEMSSFKYRRCVAYNTIYAQTFDPIVGV